MNSGFMPSRASCMKSVTPSSASCFTCATLPMCATTGMFCFFASSTIAVDHLGREPFVAHPDLDEVDVQRPCAPERPFCASSGVVGFKVGAPGIRTREIEPLAGAVHARRRELSASRASAYTCMISGLSLPGHPDRRHAPVERDRQQLPHDSAG